VFIFDNLLLCFCLVEIRKSLLIEPTIEHIHDKTGDSGHIYDKTGGSGQLGNGNSRLRDLS